MTTLAKKSSKSRKETLLSFTLIEILVVCALLAFLMAMMVAGYGMVTQKGAEAQCKSTMEIIKTALESYKAKTGYYIQCANTSWGFYVDDPNAPEANQTNNTDDDGDGMIDDNGLDFSDFINYEQMVNTGEIDTSSTIPRLLIDPFGKSYRYQCPGSHNRTSFDLQSAGNDGKLNTSDDIKNWE